MPLIDGGKNAYQDLAGFEFGTTNGDKTVRVHVSHEALDAIEPTTVKGKDYLETFRRHRTRIFGIASRKYDAGYVEGGLVHVRTSDLG